MKEGGKEQLPDGGLVEDPLQTGQGQRRDPPRRVEAVMAKLGETETKKTNPKQRQR